MRTLLLAAALAAGCGGPALQNVPHPNNGMVAGGFAAAAAAATLASPADASKKAESNKAPAETKPITVKEHVPADVFDRLDHQGSAGSGAGSAPAGPSDDDDGTRGAPTLTPAPTHPAR